MVPLHAPRLRSIGTLFIAALLLSGLSSCVPYVKYEDAVTKLSRANKVNRDLENRLKDAGLAGVGTEVALERATLKIESLEQQKRALERENGALQGTITDLETRLSELPELPVTAFQAGDAPRDVEINPETGGLVLRNDLLFAKGKASLKVGSKEVLDAIAQMIQARYPDRVVSIEGHTDNTPIKESPNADNWELGFKRSLAVFHHLVDKGIPKMQFRLTSSGYAVPLSGVDPNSVDGRTRCRRVEIRLGGAFTP
ncbi:MAG: flagellar motor protein MotB [Planctomycetota bacterium]